MICVANLPSPDFWSLIPLAFQLSVANFNLFSTSTSNGFILDFASPCLDISFLDFGFLTLAYVKEYVCAIHEYYIAQIIQQMAIRHSVDRALPALSDLQFLQLSQLFQLSQFCQFFHSPDTLSSPSSSNFEIENWKSF